MTKRYVTHLQEKKYRKVTRMNVPQPARGAKRLERTPLRFARAYFKRVQRVRAVALDWKSDSEVYIATNQSWNRSTYMCKCVRICVTDVACEGARAVRKHVRLVRSTETNWNHRRARSEVYLRDENCLEIYARYIRGVRKGFKLAVKVKDSKQSIYG